MKFQFNPFFISETICGKNEEFLKYGICEGTCDSPFAYCPVDCRPPNCYCMNGFVRDAAGNCIPLKDCPSEIQTI